MKQNFITNVLCKNCRSKTIHVMPALGILVYQMLYYNYTMLYRLLYLRLPNLHLLI